MNITQAAIIAGLMACANPTMAQQTIIQKNDIHLNSDLMTPEALWAMGRIGGVTASPDGRQMAYQVGYYSVEENKGHQVLYVSNIDGAAKKQLTLDTESETDAAWISTDRIVFLRGGQLWSMSADGTDRKQLTHDATDIEGFKFSPDGKKVILIKSLPYHGTIKENPFDLPKATGRLVTDMNYRHWDHYVESIPHPFLADVTTDGIGEGKDIMEGEPYECPTAPFGGVEQLDWSRDSRYIAYTSRKKEGVAYAISTDTDIFLYDTQNGTTRNLCKTAGYQEPAIDATKTMATQQVNKTGQFVGYDQNPQFSPDGRWLAWQSMERNGYESDQNRIYVLDLSTIDGERKGFFVATEFDSSKDAFCWSADSKSIYFTGCWHATTHIYKTPLQGNAIQLTDGQYDYGTIQVVGSGKNERLLATRHSMSHPDDIFVVTPNKKAKTSSAVQVTDENKHIFDQLAIGNITDRWIKTTNGEQMQVWVITPPHFDPSKKYPTLLYCEGGPQSPVSQFWSYRWNFQIMAAHGYVIIAPNRHGLPGYGLKWNEQISGDWTGQCMNDYLAAIDDATANLPFVDKDRLGAVGASFGGFSVYYLAGHHDGRFKCFISHDGAFNLESMYTDTEEAWFSNWEYDDAYWNKDQTDRARKTYENSPHRFIDRWDTPILCIHGEKDYRINANQGMGAFNAARLKGIPAELLIFPDENHWVLKPQNGILWQRTFFNWLDRWLK